MQGRPHHFKDSRLRPDPNVAPDDDASAEGLLDVALDIGRMVVNSFGVPEDIARRGRISAKEHHDFSTWLAGLEELVRCILFLIALTFAPRLRSRPEAPRRDGQGLHIGMRGDPEPPNLNDPYSWRFSFRYLPPAPRAAPKEISRTPRSIAHRLRKDPDALHDAFPLARRWQSIRRILNEPMLYAETLAERLQDLQHPIEIREEQPQACRRKRGRAVNPCGRAMTRAQRHAGAMLRDWLPLPEFWSSA